MLILKVSFGIIFVFAAHIFLYADEPLAKEQPDKIYDDKALHGTWRQVFLHHDGKFLRPEDDSLQMFRIFEKGKVTTRVTDLKGDKTDIAEGYKIDVTKVPRHFDQGSLNSGDLRFGIYQLLDDGETLVISHAMYKFSKLQSNHKDGGITLETRLDVEARPKTFFSKKWDTSVWYRVKK